MPIVTHSHPLFVNLGKLQEKNYIKMSNAHHFLHHEVGHVEWTKTALDSKMSSHVEETQSVLKGLKWVLIGLPLSLAM